MKRDEFERLKEEEKKHLREIGNLKQKLKEAQRMQRIGRALHDMESTGDLEGFDISLEEVQRKAAEQEARLDLAVDSSAPVDSVDIPPIDEEALQRARAAEFIQRMKVSIGDEDKRREPADTKSAGKPPKENVPVEPKASDSEFEKTIGRMTPRGKDQDK